MDKSPLNNQLAGIRVGSEFYASFGDIFVNDLVFGLEHGYLSQREVVEITLMKYESGNRSEWVLEIGALFEEDPYFYDALNSLQIRGSTRPQADVARKWIFVLIAWTFVHRDTIRLVDDRDLWDDAMELINWIWCDFGCPDHIRNLIYFLPRSGSRSGREELLLEITNFLRTESRYFGVSLEWLPS